MLNGGRSTAASWFMVVNNWSSLRRRVTSASSNWCNAVAVSNPRAAASRAANVLSQKSLSAGGAVATVDTDKCTGCLTCVRICPYQIPKIRPELRGVGGVMGAAYIEAAVCQGCGSCASECPAKAIDVMHYRDGQVMAKVDALFSFQGGPRS